MRLHPLAVVLAVSSTVARADAPPTRAAAPLAFPAGVDMVNLNVAVLAERDRYVTNLASNDFVILEDGIRQEPTLFVQENLPISVVLMLDVSASMKPHLDTVRLAAARLIDNLRPQDQAEIVQFSDRATVLQAFTSDRAALMAAVQATETGGGTALHNALYVTLKDVATMAKTEEIRRRAVVLLSDGEDTASMISDDRVLEVARSCEISVYSILLGVSTAAASTRRDQARYLLSALARESGGQAFFPASASALGRLYGGIAQELRSQYNIGYVSSNPTLDGSWRQILVMTPRHGRFEVRHRLGYYAVPEAPLSKARLSDRGSAGRYRVVAGGAAGQP
jgi:Ca-activated chloride channel homolog